MPDSRHVLGLLLAPQLDEPVEIFNEGEELASLCDYTPTFFPTATKNVHIFKIP